MRRRRVCTPAAVLSADCAVHSRCVCVLSSCSIESPVFADVLSILLETFVDICLIHAPACNIPCGYDFAVLAGCSCNQVLFVCVLLLASMGVPC